ncbi:MAG: InlB B-repeat-containing protein, partial [Mogibacterium sp.]|nr:InlB B-repeat-containing protein [Mogibacterium sp.]
NGWYTNAELTEEYNPQLAIYADTVLYAKWLEIHTVSFDTYGMCKAIEPLKVTHGWTTELPVPQAPKGYTFSHWCSDENGFNQVSSNTPITEDLTLYAFWAIQADSTTVIDNITIHFDNYPVPDQPLTTDGVYVDAGDNTSLIQLRVPAWSEWDYYAFDENRLPTSECKPSTDSGSVLHFRAGKYYMYSCRIHTNDTIDPRISVEVPSAVFPENAILTVDCPNMLDYECWGWGWCTDPESGERVPNVLQVSVVFKAPEYKVIEDEITDTTYETGTDDGVTLHFNGDLALFDELVIDGNVVPKDQYTLTEGSTIVTLKSSYLETLGTGDHTVTAVYNTNMYNVDNAKDEVATVITVKKSEDKPAEPDPSSGNGNAPAPVPTATPINTSGSPNTGDITSITGYLVSGALSLAGIVGINKKRKK